jgi:DNA (cytosine-5)-methyltransferase 1
MDTLKNELKYKTVEHKVIDSSPWVPQKRERIFIVGFREECSFSFNDFEPDSTYPKLGSILNSDDNVPTKYTLTPHLWRYLQSYKEKHASKGNGFGCSVFGPNDVTRTLSARYYKDGSEILVKQHGTRPRRLMPEECARLMGFVHKDGSPWKIPVSDTQAYKQFGNAVVVPVARAVARHMEKHILEAVDHEPQNSSRLNRSTKRVPKTRMKPRRRTADG